MPPDIAEALVRRAREGEPVPLVPIPSGIWRQTARSDANDAGKPYRLIRTDDEDDHEWEGSILGQHVPGYRRIQILTDFIRDNWPEHTSEIKFSTIRPAIAQAELRRLIEKIAAITPADLASLAQKELLKLVRRCIPTALRNIVVQFASEIIPKPKRGPRDPDRIRRFQKLSGELIAGQLDN